MPMTNAEKQAAWRKRRDEELMALRAEVQRLRNELSHSAPRPEDGAWTPPKDARERIMGEWDVRFEEGETTTVQAFMDWMLARVLGSLEDNHRIDVLSLENLRFQPAVEIPFRARFGCGEDDEREPEDVEAPMVDLFEAWEQALEES